MATPVDSMNQTPGEAEDVVSDKTENKDTQSPGIWGWLKNRSDILKHIELLSPELM